VFEIPFELSAINCQPSAKSEGQRWRSMSTLAFLLFLHELEAAG
jgi:hypothetical protein